MMSGEAAIHSPSTSSGGGSNMRYACTLPIGSQSTRRTAMFGRYGAVRQKVRRAVVEAVATSAAAASPREISATVSEAIRAEVARK